MTWYCRERSWQPANCDGRLLGHLQQQQDDSGAGADAAGGARPQPLVGGTHRNKLVAACRCGTTLSREVALVWQVHQMAAHTTVPPGLWDLHAHAPLGFLSG